MSNRDRCRRDRRCVTRQIVRRQVTPRGHRSHCAETRSAPVSVASPMPPSSDRFRTAPPPRWTPRSRPWMPSSRSCTPPRPSSTGTATPACAPPSASSARAGLGSGTWSGSCRPSRSASSGHGGISVGSAGPGAPRGRRRIHGPPGPGPVGHLRRRRQLHARRHRLELHHRLGPRQRPGRRERPTRFPRREPPRVAEV